MINGRKIANNVLDTISERTKQWPFDRIPPSLAVVLVGDDASSVLYVNNKTKAANRSGEYIFINFGNQMSIVPLDK